MKAFLKNLLQKRKYGQHVNGENIGITLASIIESKDPELGTYLGISSGFGKRKKEEKAAREMQITAMKLATENLQKKNQANRKESRLGSNALFGS